MNFYIDEADKVQMLIDPTSTYARAAAAAMGRAMDDSIIAAATGSALTGKTGGTSTALTQTIANGSADMTVAKLIEAKKKLDDGSVDPSIPRHIVVGPDQIEALLGTTSVTSSDFNTVKALVQGEIDTFMGFKFHTSTRLSKSGNIRKCFAFAEDGLKLAVGKDVMSEIERRADKSYSTQVFYCASFGATRMEEAKVVSIDCDESA